MRLTLTMAMPVSMPPRRALYGAWSALLLLAGCASDPNAAYFSTPSRATVYVAPEPTSVRKIAVMPFKAQTELIGASVSDLFMTELLKAGRYDVVERSQLTQVLGESELALSGISASRAAQLGQMVGAEAVVIGTVAEYGTVPQRGRTYPVVGVSARMIDSQTSRVIWSADLACQSPSARIPLSEHARNTVHEVVSGLYRAWR